MICCGLFEFAGLAAVRHSNHVCHFCRQRKSQRNVRAALFVGVNRATISVRLRTACHRLAGRSHQTCGVAFVSGETSGNDTGEPETLRYRCFITPSTLAAMFQFRSRPLTPYPTFPPTNNKVPCPFSPHCVHNALRGHLSRRSFQILNRGLFPFFISLSLLPQTVVINTSVLLQQSS
jgi:hypothetical protein